MHNDGNLFYPCMHYAWQEKKCMDALFIHAWLKKGTFYPCMHNFLTMHAYFGLFWGGGAKSMHGYCDQKNKINAWIM
jgi:hypothetical protein